MKDEIRKLVSTWLMNLTLSVLPAGEFKLRYAQFMKMWIKKL